MREEEQKKANERYLDAVRRFADKAKTDPSVTAVLVGGSLADGQVWAKSDVDLSVLVRDQVLKNRHYSLDEDGIVLNVDLYTVTDFKKSLGKSRGGSFQHSYYGKGYFIFTRDESLNGLLEDFRAMGEGDIEHTFFEYACYFIGSMEKVEKWLSVWEDPLYAQFYLLKAGEMLANMRLILGGQPVSREAVLKVEALEPGFIAPYYSVPLSGRLSREEVEAALASLRSFLDERFDLLFGHVKPFMEEGGTKTVTELCSRFGMDSHSITHVFDYFVEMGALERVTETIRLTPQGKKCVEETAYLYFPH